jgi:hypothetical protein
MASQSPCWAWGPCTKGRATRCLLWTNPPCAEYHRSSLQRICREWHDALEGIGDREGEWTGGAGQRFASDTNSNLRRMRRLVPERQQEVTRHEAIGEEKDNGNVMTSLRGLEIRGVGKYMKSTTMHECNGRVRNFSQKSGRLSRIPRCSSNVCVHLLHSNILRFEDPY